MEVEANCTVAARLKELLQKSISHNRDFIERFIDNETCMSIEKELDIFSEEDISKITNLHTAAQKKSYSCKGIMSLSFYIRRKYLMKTMFQKEV